jgi:hypothetical protein
MSSPLSVLETSSTALASGVTVPSPTCCALRMNETEQQQRSNNMRTIVLLFIIFYLLLFDIVTRDRLLLSRSMNRYRLNDISEILRISAFLLLRAMGM